VGQADQATEGTVLPRNGSLRGVSFLRRSLTLASWSPSCRKIGQLDNTLIITGVGQWRQLEGGPNGSFSELLFLEQCTANDRLELEARQGLGRASPYCHYSWGWAWACNTPFRKWKQIVTRGGTSDLCIVHWPKGIKAKGEIRHQFVHAIDLVPTTLEVLKQKMPTSSTGWRKRPIEGVSFAKTFDDPKAPLPREAQYFEMLGSRSIQLDGWRAHVGAPNWPSGEPTTAEYMDNAPWMLFNLNEDFPKRSIWRPRTRPSSTS